MELKAEYGMADELEVEFERAMAHFEAGDLANAERVCRALLTQEPCMVDLHHLLGAVLLQVDRVGEAVDAFLRAAELDPAQAEIHGNLAVAYEAMGQLGPAAKAYRQALDLAPDDPLLHAGIGAVWQSLGKYDLARDSYRATLDLGEKSPQILFNLAVAERMTARPSDAADICRQLVEEAPANADAWNLFAICLTELGDFEQAALCFEKVLALDAGRDGVHGSLAVVLTKLDRREAARAAFERAITAPIVDADCLLNFGMMLEEEGEETRALELYGRALDLDESSALNCETFAKLAKRLGENALVIARLSDLARRQPSLSFAWFYLGYAHMARWETDQAKDAMGRYQALDPEDRLGSQLVLGAGGAIPLPDGPGDAFLKQFYRERAAKWDQTVTDAYHGHEIIMKAFDAYLSERGKAEVVLDAGCGSGGLGVLIRPKVGRLDGVDMSPEMVTQARLKEIYDTLETGDLFEFLRLRTNTYDGIVAAAVLFHYRDLAAVLTPIRAALRPSGQTVFTVFKSAAGEVALNDQGFFEHSKAMVEESVSRAGLRLLEIEEAIHEYNSDNQPRPCFGVRCVRD
ncbi:MAG: tetratricopeptide repeat protein [Proteobacteria bacterium]|nr:tetratricopeptide repeat protein [Pseudomonadota bacterium]